MRAIDPSLRALAGLVAASLVLVALTGCGAGGAGQSKPNVIFLTVDTLRADHLALYGYERNTMPWVESFAEEAVVFDNAVVPRGVTRPSYASMLTGLYPHRHGVRDQFTELHPDIETLAERLRADGYRTAGFVSNYVLIGELSGLDQGFDLYDDFVNEKPDDKSIIERPAPGTLKAIHTWLASEPPEPFFLFVNLIDPHGPYTPPERLRETFQSERTRLLTEEQIPEYHRLTGEGSRNFWDYVDRYDEEIRHADEALASLAATLEAEGLWEGSLVIFTADHGESMGEHGVFFEHTWNLWEETNRVPLAIKPPEGWGELRRGRVRTVVSPMDLPATVLEILGLDLPPAQDGHSLVPLLEGQENDRRVVFLEFPNTYADEGESPEWYSVRTPDLSLIQVRDQVSGALHMQALFDLRRDPLQLDPRPPLPSSPRHAALVGTLNAWVEEVRTHELPFTPKVQRIPVEERDAFVREHKKNREVVPLTEDQIEKLRSLGYVE